MTTQAMRRSAFVAGLLYLITFLSSIPAVFLLAPALTNPDWILGVGATGQVRLGALLDIVNCLTAIGTAIALYSVVRRQHGGFAIGFVASRTLEAAVLLIGTVAVMAMVTLRDTGVPVTDPRALVTVGQSLIAVRDWSFALGTGVPALNAFFLGWLMLRSGLVPRAIPVLGLIGAPLFGSWVAAYVLGIADAGGAWHGIAVAPIFIWELSLGLWMTFKGFRKEAPLMIEAAAVTAAQASSATDATPSPTRPAAGIATKAGAA